MPPCLLISTEKLLDRLKAFLSLVFQYVYTHTVRNTYILFCKSCLYASILISYAVVLKLSKNI